mmetsp:Transcript_425/g.499  ORF Transcript_425/g.499 Transcript_425/m.499 type:complete len:96 (+) Transcript_425:174-461(+)
MLFLRRGFSSSTIDIFCAKCNGKLYKYRKKGKGSLVKCIVQKIQKDYTAPHTSNSEPKKIHDKIVCHSCGTQFARYYLYKGKHAHKLIGGKVFTR